MALNPDWTIAEVVGTIAIRWNELEAIFSRFLVDMINGDPRIGEAILDGVGWSQVRTAISKVAPLALTDRAVTDDLIALLKRVDALNELRNKAVHSNHLFVQPNDYYVGNPPEMATVRRTRRQGLQIERSHSSWMAEVAQDIHDAINDANAIDIRIRNANRSGRR